MKTHIAFLDELRGLAALSVALLHASQFFEFGLYSHAYLAVDFFFCLSGFVLANGYDQKLKSGVLPRSLFFVKRIIRLYPMIMVGVVLAVLIVLLTSGPYSIIPLGDISILAAGGLLLLPFGLMLGQQAFSINNPLWSLFFEMAASTIYGATARLKVQTWQEIALLAFLAFALFWVIDVEGTIQSVGFENWQTFLEGFVRVGFSFFAGVFIFRWDINNRLGKVSPHIPLSALILVLFLPFQINAGVYDFISIAVVIPIVVALAAAVSLHEERALALHLGRLSYPFYVVHQPILRLGAQVQSATGGVVPLPIMVSFTLLAAGCLAHVLSTCFDQPFRAYLARKLT